MSGEQPKELLAPQKVSTSSPPAYSASTSNPPRTSSSHQKGHYSRPSQELAAHDRLTRKDSRARKTIPRDQIDDLDNILGSYHHEGPFDATLASRQIPGRAPIDAVKYTNSLALHHTPSSNIEKSVRGHEPLDGTAGRGPGYVGASIHPGEASNYDFEHVGDLPRRADYDSDEDEDEDQDGLGSRGEYEMKKASSSKQRGVVEYDPILDRSDGRKDDDEDALDALDLGSSSTAQHGGLVSSLKKRLSIKKSE